MKQKLGTRPYGHYLWGGQTKNAGVSNWSGSPCWFSPSCWPLSFPLWGPLSSKRPNDSHSGRAPTTHKMDPYTANHQATQACPGSVAAGGRKNLACQKSALPLASLASPRPLGSDNSPIYAEWIPLPVELREESFVCIHHRYF